MGTRKSTSKKTGTRKIAETKARPKVRVATAGIRRTSTIRG